MDWCRGALRRSLASAVCLAVPPLALQGPARPHVSQNRTKMDVDELLQRGMGA